MGFAYPGLLILAALVPFAGLWWSFLRARREKALSRLTLVLPPTHGGSLQLVLVVLGLTLCLLAAARPQWGKSQEVTLSGGRNVVVAIDVSRSMLAADVRPNRLERVKADVADLIDDLAGDRCALVAFRHTGELICPLTTDHAFLHEALESLTPESAAKGETDLGSAIRAALGSLDREQDAHHAIILISDGGDLCGTALSSAQEARKRGIPIFTVGIGHPQKGATIPTVDGRGVQMYQGKPVEVKLEEEALKAIAELSNGYYIPLATSGTAETTLGSIYRNFLRKVAILEQREEELRLGERFQVFLLPGLVLLLIGASLSRGRFRRVPAKAV